MLAPQLARAAYEDRHLPSGELDAGILAVLADALEEAPSPQYQISNSRHYRVLCSANR
jgi:hypothetical protein